MELEDDIPSTTVVSDDDENKDEIDEKLEVKEGEA